MKGEKKKKVRISTDQYRDVNSHHTLLLNKQGKGFLSLNIANHFYETLGILICEFVL